MPSLMMIIYLHDVIPGSQLIVVEQDQIDKHRQFGAIKRTHWNDEIEVVGLYLGVGNHSGLQLPI